MSDLRLPPLSLYIHIPWCQRKCPYCDFNSHESRHPLPEADYVDALLRDLEQDLAYVQGRSLQSIFIGGGTPSLLTGDALGQVSSQTLPHLVAVSKQSTVPILRPLLGMPKEAIIDQARVVGTAEMSARAREVCDLSEGQPVATGAREASVARSKKATRSRLMGWVRR